jgi:hypothetical protein
MSYTGLGLAVAAAFWAWSGQVDRVRAQPVRRGPPIEFSDPRGDLLTTNANRILRGEGQSSPLEEQLRHQTSPLELMGDPLRRAPLLRPPPGPRIQNPRVRELLEKQRDWLQSGSDPLANLPSLEGERRLRENPLETERSDRRGEDAWERPSGSDDGSGWGTETEPGQEGLQSDPGGRAARDARTETPEARAARLRMDELEAALRRDGEARSLVRQLPGLADSVWQTPDEVSRRAFEERQKEARNQRLQQFRAGLDAVATAPPGELGSVMSGTEKRGAAGAASTGLAPLWLKPMPDPLGVGGAGALTGRSGPGWGTGGWASETTPSSLPGAQAASPLTAPSGGVLSSPLSTPPAPVTPRIRGPNMSSPFTEIPKRPGI